MADITQILLIIVASVLTALLSIVGIQVFRILQEFQKTVEKTNKILDDVGVVSEKIARPTFSISGLIMGIRNGLEIFNVFRDRRKNSQEVKEERT